MAVQPGAEDADQQDALVAIAAKPLAALGLELRAVQRLIADGRLRAVAIGRRRFTRKSYLLALVDELSPVAPTRRDDEPEDDLLVAVARAAARRAKRDRRSRDKGPNVSEEIAGSVRIPFSRKLR